MNSRVPSYAPTGDPRPRTRVAVLIVALAVGTAAGLVAAQTQPAPEPAAPATPAPDPPPPSVTGSGSEPYSYNPAGRRDPFLNLLSRGTDLRASGRRPDGVAGLMINEVRVRGVVKSGAIYVAMIQAPDGKTYVIRPDDRLLDGNVKTIGPDAITFMQDVNDPLSLVKQREVRRPLRPTEDVK